MWNKLLEQSLLQKSPARFSVVLPPFSMRIIIIVMIIMIIKITMIMKIIVIMKMVIVLLITLSTASACQVQARTQQQGLQTRAHTWS